VSAARRLRATYMIMPRTTTRLPVRQCPIEPCVRVRRSRSRPERIDHASAVRPTRPQAGWPWWATALRDGRCLRDDRTAAYATTARLVRV